MTLERIACIGLSILMTSSIAAGQSRNDQGPTSKVVERTYDTNVAPWRVVSTRSSSAGAEVSADVLESPNVDGRMVPIQETVKETRAMGASERTKVEVFIFGPDGRRRSLQTTESQRDMMANGDTNAVHDTFTRDLNGGTALTSRRVELTRTVAPNVRQVETTVAMPDQNEALHDTTRTEETERRIDARTVRQDGTHLVRDVNGRWQPAEQRSREARDTAASERLDEQAIQRPDLNGHWSPIERRVSRGSSTNDDVVIETYAPVLDRLPDSGSGLALSERVSRTVRKNADGSSHTVEEVEGRNLAAPGDPMRVIRRTETTLRPIGSNRWVTERQVFERDVNGRMQRVSAEVEESSAP